MISIDEVLSFVVMAHKDQKDLDGKPAILHPIRVGLCGENEKEMITGFLHDVVEDTDFSFDDLEKLGIEDDVLEALGLLTRRKDIPYDEYVEKLLASMNKLALTVKRHDLMDNLSRNDRRTEQKRKIYEKHAKTLQKLNSLKSKLLDEK